MTWLRFVKGAVLYQRRLVAKLNPWKGHLSTPKWSQRIANRHNFWSNYSDLTRVFTPNGGDCKGNPLISFDQITSIPLERPPWPLAERTVAGSAQRKLRAPMQLCAEPLQNGVVSRPGTRTQFFEGCPSFFMGQIWKYMGHLGSRYILGASQKLCTLTNPISITWLSNYLINLDHQISMNALAKEQIWVDCGEAVMIQRCSPTKSGKNSVVLPHFWSWMFRTNPDLARWPTVDGWNPAPVDMENIPLFTWFYTSHVVQDFFHQQYDHRNNNKRVHVWGQRGLWPQHHSKRTRCFFLGGATWRRGCQGTLLNLYDQLIIYEWMKGEWWVCRYHQCMI